MTGSELRRLRTQAGLTQQELARRADVNRRTIIRWETGKFPIPAMVARGLETILAGVMSERAGST
ncbi:MAG TPA: helix-turn-helix transcriptional regulator [Candidatus Bathyarchaeia archaeon]|nr:helix-turn-helix transcriptional regulator [Candidatus Bathyarchaeia archaeon]